MTRDLRMKQQGKDWRKNNGKKSKKEQVLELIEIHPKATKKELQRLSALSRITILKWKKVIEKEQ